MKLFISLLTLGLISQCAVGAGYQDGVDVTVLDIESTLSSDFYNKTSTDALLTSKAGTGTVAALEK
jgi:hypothetical protein